ncbi:WD40 repeat-like protein [Teratosphaeria nubilosa]|uniref:WD40 repeat-like protein n=1 Tax=Teratosphaeria nubilosa TaxID=161662 RepID=A0A6G1KUP4_9PEZI|nr:WD40 repeat-like protein [Teratosphaeria nubilosa]
MLQPRAQQQPTPGADDTDDRSDPYGEIEGTERREHVHAQGKLCRHDHDHDGLRHRHRDPGDGEQNITIPAASKLVEQTVAPFLAEHIPSLHAVGLAPRAAQQDEHREEPNTKFCYRHRPDLKCRRQGDEPSMAQLQHGLSSLSQSDQQAISHVWSLFSAAPAKHRNLMLQGILTQCCFPQLSFISAHVRDLIKIDFLSALPPELGFKILCYLDTTSLCKAAQVSQRWRSLADDDVVWHKMCEQHIDRKCTKCGWGLPLLERKRLRIEKRQIQLRATGQRLDHPTPAATPLEADDRSLSSEGSASPELQKRQCLQSIQGKDHRSANDGYFAPKRRPWKDVYKDRFKVGTAWKYGRCSTKVFKGHTNGVMCLQFDDSVLITGSYDSTVKVWDINTGRELRTLTGHTSGIRCLQFDDNKLMTGSLDHTLKLWNWKTGECLRTFNAHTGGIISLHFTADGRYVASGSMDNTIRVWDSLTKQTWQMRGHTDWVNSVRVDEQSRTLFSASDDLTVRLWDLDTRECVKVFEGHVGQVQQVLPMPAEYELDNEELRRLAELKDKNDDASSVSSVTEAAQLIGTSTRARRRSLETQDKPTLPFWPHDQERSPPPRYMLTGALDSTIRLWDFVLPTDPLTNSHTPRAQACVRTFFGHVEGIWALAADHLRLVSGSEDKMIKVWDPRTGKCERTIGGHAGPVTCAWLSDWAVASGSEDCEVRMLCFGDPSERDDAGSSER